MASDYIASHFAPNSTIVIASSYYWTPAILRSYATPYKVIDVLRLTTEDHDKAADFLNRSTPDAFVLSDAETRDFTRQPELFPAYTRALRDIMERRCREVARFETSPQLGPFHWSKGYPPWDWLFAYPTIRVFVPVPRRD